MNALLARIDAEPVLVVTLVQALLTVAVTFGARLTPEQTGALLIATGAALNILARKKVSPTP